MTRAPSGAEEVLAAGALAPSAHNSQPWELRAVASDVYEVRGDPRRALPVSDPDGRAVRVAGGAALLNMRFAVRARGRRAHVHLLPDPADPWSLARLQVGGPLAPTAPERALADAIPRRHTTRRAFLDLPVALAARAALRRAAEAERGWLCWLDDPTQRREVELLVAAARRAQEADPAWVAERSAHTGCARGALDGLTADAGGPRPPVDDPWRVDLTGGRGEPDGRESEPLILVLGTFVDRPLAQVQAGQALQRVLLTATVYGLAASFVAPPLEVPEHRAALRGLLGGGLWPQAMLRVGHGVDGVPVPRRPVAGA
ncbi:nitroreductase [Actinomycetospora sp. OC33-EN08]|uniref:Nitroreductase n=1 Tax=Actinomycetospora aurantiaca TaxID=3129233 RepID=A0ABU8MFK6_9PSEU